MDRTGQQLGNYQLLRLLGRGGFAEVYLGEHIYLNTQAALKILNNPLSGHDNELFLREARTIARLIHPRIIRVLDFGIDRQTPYLIMDYVPNKSLRDQYSKGTRISLDKIVLYVKQIAEALQYAHDQGIIHRDVKPENILMKTDSELFLSDFGIAAVTHNSATLNLAGVVRAGTPPYMAPEQFADKQYPASDQYALAIMVYEWLSGAPPFRGDWIQAAYLHAHTPPPPLREKAPTLSQNIEDTVTKALAKQPQQRFESVQAFAQALEEAYQLFTTNTIYVPKAVVICPRCGTPNRPGAKFCKKDGHPLAQGAIVPAQTQTPSISENRPQPQPAKASMPHSDTLYETDASSETYRTALHYLANNRYTDAIAQFQTMLSKNGAHFDILYSLGSAYRLYGLSLKDANQQWFRDNMRNAIKYFEEAVGQKVDALDTYFQLGQCYRDIALYPQAINAFKRALELASEDEQIADISSQLASCHLQIGRRTEATQMIKNALQHNPNNIEALRLQRQMTEFPAR
jgi:serine/threonine protein kinase